ncbi:DUF58 domain-containing protein [Longimicrobium sp.]|uniref:DUF58 domain-containing protein n=1 Tax=Longimicrobium sp. TaxID=2029185 RepID=UPI002E3022E7|nr:DUF58 domain-containing protein [Longimicrobium sp.]HEX6040971.1 DUF58 domain-containing protein [Longimicrobium sp.]
MSFLSRLRRASAPAADPDALGAPPPGLADIMRQVRRIDLRTRGLVASQFTGEYHSVFKGQGIEFVEVREYVPGDDVRTIDWNVSARTGSAFVKKYVEERELTVLLAVDLSASQRWGTRGRTKSEMVPEVAATLAMSAVRNNDRVGLLVFTDRVETFVPPQKGRRHALRILRDLLVFQPEGRGTDLVGSLEHARRVLRSRSIVFLVSDFRMPEGGRARLEKALGGVALRHDVIPVVLADPADAKVPDVGVLRVMDPETGRAVYVDTDVASERFTQQAQSERTELRRLFRRLGMDEIELRTDGVVSTSVLSFFRRRERRLRR